MGRESTVLCQMCYVRIHVKLSGTDNNVKRSPNAFRKLEWLSVRVGKHINYVQQIYPKKNAFSLYMYMPSYKHLHQKIYIIQHNFLIPESSFYMSIEKVGNRNSYRIPNYSSRVLILCFQCLETKDGILLADNWILLTIHGTKGTIGYYICFT